MNRLEQMRIRNQLEARERSEAIYERTIRREGPFGEDRSTKGVFACSGGGASIKDNTYTQAETVNTYHINQTLNLTLKIPKDSSDGVAGAIVDAIREAFNSNEQQIIMTTQKGGTKTEHHPKDSK